MTEDTPAAVASATRAVQLYCDLGDRSGQAAALTMIDRRRQPPAGPGPVTSAIGSARPGR